MEELLRRLSAEEFRRATEDATGIKENSLVMEYDYRFDALNEIILGAPVGASGIFPASTKQHKTDTEEALEHVLAQENNNSRYFTANNCTLKPWVGSQLMVSDFAAAYDACIVYLYVKRAEEGISSDTLNSVCFTKSQVRIHQWDYKAFVCGIQTVRNSISNFGYPFESPLVVPVLDEIDRQLFGTLTNEDISGATNIIVIPCGAFHYFPLDLIERFRGKKIFYTHSLNSMSALELYRSFYPPKTGSLFACHDDVSRLAHLEIADLEQHFAGINFENGKGKTKNEILELLASAEIAHFACHGKYDEKRGEPVLSVPGAEISVPDIVPLLMQARLVVCSSCESALGEADVDEGLKSLSRAFLAAGARCVIVSLWRVNSRATRRFMQHFYNAFVVSSDVADALRTAKANMREGYWQHPYYWAGFIAYGVAVKGKPWTILRSGLKQIDSAAGEGAHLVRRGDLLEGLQKFLMVQQALQPIYVEITRSGQVPGEIQKIISTTLATCLNNIGYVYQSQGDLAQALAFYRQALAIDEAIAPNSTETATRLNNIGSIYQSQGDLTQALLVYRRALAINEAIAPNSTETATRLNNIGSIYQSQGDLTQALLFYRRALVIDEATAPNSTETATDLNNIGSIYQSQGDLTQALLFYRRALAINEATAPNSTETATRLNNIGYVYQSQGDLTQALAFYRRALVIDEATAPNSTETAIRLNNIGYVYQSQGDLTQALAFYDKAILVRESLRERATDRQSREKMGSLEGTLNPYWASLYLRTQRRSAEDAATAFRTGELLRARVLTERMTEHRYEPATEDEARLLTQWRIAQGRYDQIYTIRQQVDRDPAAPSEYGERVHAAEDEAKREQDTLRKQVEALMPAFAALFKPAAPLTLAEVQSRVLDPGTLLLSYCFFGSRFVAWAIRTESVDWLDIDVESAWEALLTLRTAAASGVGITALPQDAVDAAQTLQKMLLPNPESPQWDGVTCVLIAPDGPLYSLPFELLPRLASLPVTYIPSATTLDEMRRRQDKTPAEGTFLGFGDPDSGFMESDGTRMSVSRLPQAGFEVLRIKEKHAGEVEVYTDKDATKGRVLDKAPRFRRLHFATHGAFDSDDPFASYLLFAPDEGKTDNSDKLLFARELLGLRLCADLVVCSACQTGLGSIQNGEGLMGLSRAFLAAGAHCLVVSLWSVEDRATRVFMERFYDNMEGRTVENALLRTRQQMQEGIWSHPVYWAGFVAYGITTDTQPVFGSGAVGSDLPDNIS